MFDLFPETVRKTITDNRGIAYRSQNESEAFIADRIKEFRKADTFVPWILEPHFTHYGAEKITLKHPVFVFEVLQYYHLESACGECMSHLHHSKMRIQFSGPREA